ncbi:phage portal protein [Desulfovibrio sp. OttesenSCG-928-A18]|nr:phage portal protein [Desulfovibrio sp. OttesenSCG-928-A18]
MFQWFRNIFSKRVVKPQHQQPESDRYRWFRYGEVLVNEDTALTLSAVYRAATYIAQTTAILPWGVYEDYQVKGNDPVHWLLRRRPNSEMSPFEFKRLMVFSALLRGNAYAEIEFNNAGVPMGLWPLPSHSVAPRRDSSGTLFYRVSGIGDYVDIPASHIFHVKNIGSDGIVGISIIGLASRSIGMGIAAEEFGSNLFQRQAVPSGVLEVQKELSGEAADRLRTQFGENFGGGKNAGKPIVLEEGMKWSSIIINPEDLQFIESRKFTIEEIARWFGLPPHKLADLTHGTFSNIEHLSIEVVNDAITPWCKCFEEEADYKLLGRRRGNVYTKLDLRGLLRGDNESRMRGYATGLQNGLYCVNECREWEDLPPVPGGDKYFVQMQMTPLEQAGVVQQLTTSETDDGPESSE